MASRIVLFQLILLLAAAGPALAADPPGIVPATQAGGDSGSFSAGRGEQLFTTRGRDWSCATCHTADPRNPGRHTVTGKTIAPMAPAVNPERLGDPAKVAKWFRRNCKDVFARECTPQEQGDVIAYLRSLGK